MERLVVVNHGWQSEATDGPKGGWGLLSFSLFLSLSLSFSLFLWLPTYLPTDRPTDLSIYLSLSLSLSSLICLSNYLSIFRPSGATNHWKNTVFRDFPTFSRTWIFFLLRLSLFWSSFFFSSLLWLFPSLLFICPYCRKFDFYRQWPFGGQYPIFRPSISPLIY